MKDEICPECGNIAMKKINKIFSLSFLKCQHCGQKLRISTSYTIPAIVVVMLAAILMNSGFGVKPLIAIGVSLLAFLPFNYFFPLEARK